MISPPCRVAAVLLGTLVALLLSAPAQAAEPTGLTEPVRATHADLSPTRMYSSPALAVDPENPLRVVAGFADLLTRRCGVLRSVDGGATWTQPDASPNTADYPFCSQSQGGVIQAPVAFGGGGMLYMALGGWSPEESSRAGGAVMVARSSDLGDSWQTSVVRTSRGKTGKEAENLRPVQGIAVERRGGDDDVVYLTFSKVLPAFKAPDAVPPGAMVAVSRDGGRTFDEGVDLADGVFESADLRQQALSATPPPPGGPGGGGPPEQPPAGTKGATPDQAANFGGRGGRNGTVVGVDGKGTAYVLWGAGSVNVVPRTAQALFLSTSSDAGRTWTTTQATPFGPDNPTGGPAFAGQQMVVAEDGTLHIVYGLNPRPKLAAYGEVYHRVSRDGGKTWSDLEALSDDVPEDLKAQFFPNISIAPNGRLDVVWWDTRDDPGTRSNDVYYTSSDDDGQSWSGNRRITDQSVDRRFGVYGLGYDIAAPPGVASADAYAIFGWDDTRNSGPPPTGLDARNGTGVQDIYTSAAQFAPVAVQSSSTARIMLAGVVGLLMAGLFLVIAFQVNRRRIGSSSGGAHESLRGVESTSAGRAPR